MGELIEVIIDIMSELMPESGVGVIIWLVSIAVIITGAVIYYNNFM